MLICANCGRDNPPGAGFCNSCGAALAIPAASREVRKTVTVLFCDLTGSTALGEQTDPEALRALLARYFERMKTIVEPHGGTVEKFIGDAVMAVFGFPLRTRTTRCAHAGRRWRCATRCPSSGSRGRIGVNTGEVVTGTEERLATGDAVTSRRASSRRPRRRGADRRADARARARGGVGGAGRAVDAEGKVAAGAGLRLVSVLDAPERSHASRFVGRERELRSLAEAWERAQAQARCELVTVVGDAGVGKSRLVAEALTAWRLVSSGAAACPTARGSRTGRWSRW